MSVLRQAWVDRLRPILVINKLDRLVTELKQTPMEAYHHLSQLIEQANAVMGSFFAGERMEDDLRWREERERRLARKKDAIALQADALADDNDETEAGEDFQEKDDEDIYFAPEKGNVVFASALGGWGFRIAKFAQIFAVKLGIGEANFKRVLWGDFYLDPKTKRVISHKHLRGRSLKPLFVQFVLENIWSVYDAVLLSPWVYIFCLACQRLTQGECRNAEKINKIVSTLNLRIPPRDLNSKDRHSLLSLILTQWLPLSTTTIQAIIDIVPSPRAAQPTRIPMMLYPDVFESYVEPKSKLEKDLYACDASESAHVIAYVSKMFAVSTAQLPEHKKQSLTVDDLRARAREARDRAEESREQSRAASPSSSPCYICSVETLTGENPGDLNPASETLLGFARLYSGVIRVGSTVACVLPKYHNDFEPTHPRNRSHVVNATVDALYTMMGRDLVSVDSVSAGNIFAIRGLDGSVWRTATICAPSTAGIQGEHSQGWMTNLGAINRQVWPMFSLFWPSS